MGIIKAAMSSVSGALGDQWLEAIEPAKELNNGRIATYGINLRKGDSRNTNRKGTASIISNGSYIHVPENTFMLLVDGGKIVAASEEPGYYRVDNSTAPSIFYRATEGVQAGGFSNAEGGNIERPGGLVNTFKDSFERFKFGGGTPQKQYVVYINKQEITQIKYGTKQPISYTDRVLVRGRVVPCKLTSFGMYTIRIQDPILFYREVLGKSEYVDFDREDIKTNYENEFMQAFATALAKFSMDYVLVTDIEMKREELGLIMADKLDEDWLKRGFLIEAVGIGSISFDEKTNELLDKYGNDSILMDPNAQSARIAAGYAAGMEAAGSNSGGAMMGFAGMAMGMNAGNGMGVNRPVGQQNQGYNPNYDQQATQPQQQQAQVQGGATVGGWTCQCGNQLPKDAKFCTQCGKPKPVDQGSWTCECGSANTSLFCPKCGSKKPEPSTSVKCSNCGYEPEDQSNLPAFCPKCGNKFS